MSVPIYYPATTALTTIDEELAVLADQREHWRRVDNADRIELLDDAIRRLVARADAWVSTCLRAKGFEPGTLAEAEEWLYVASIARALRMLKMSLSETDDHGRPRISGPSHLQPDGRVVAQVFPRDRWDRLLFRGITGEVWMQPGVDASEVFQQFDKADQAKVALVLGAGNASMLPVIDVLHRLFVENQVVILKPNPINAYLGPFIEDVFHSLVTRGFLRIVYGDITEGEYLCTHPVVEELHLTGSSQTFDAIVFGPGDEGQERKAQGEPLLTKPFTGELGNISPVIVVPGPWSDDDLRDQAEQISTWFVANAGFGCLTPRVVVQHASWQLRAPLVDEIGRILDATPTRPAYYRGAHDIHAAFLDAHPDARQSGASEYGHLPWTFITDLDPTHSGEVCFRREAFCSIMSETALQAEGVVEYIQRAVEFANDRLWGTLNATIIVHPESLRDPTIAAAVQDGIDRLRYGTVLVNMASFAGFYFMVTPWGAYPGHQATDIQSGTGKTANFMMFRHPEKSVIRGPFNSRLDPIRITARRPHAFARSLFQFEASPTVTGAARVAWSGLYQGRAGTKP